eukprot:Seg23898.2 transcript_id=Seg23898.2/GoldUCD/mRNA.D3Y31 product="hypothetical protein" pseudo=true protein_id=Seg23898.2/GoldUCD/D3Y31
MEGKLAALIEQAPEKSDAPPIAEPSPTPQKQAAAPAQEEPEEKQEPDNKLEEEFYNEPLIAQALEKFQISRASN